MSEDTSRVRELLKSVDVTRFSYDHETREFIVGARRVSVSDAGKNYLLLSPELEDESTKTDPMLGHVGWRHVMFPGMYDWLNNNFSRELSDETSLVMAEVFTDIQPEAPADHRGMHIDRLFGFSAERLRSEHPHLTLSVLGNCACYGVSIDGLFGQYDWHAKFASFEMHNVDTPVQEVSLQAGLGHLAFRAEQDSL